MSAKFHRPEQMLQWLALSAAPNEFTQRCEFILRENALKLEVELQAFAIQRLR